VERSPEPVAVGRIAHTPHRLSRRPGGLQIMGKLIPSAPISIGALASHGSLAAIRASGTQGVPDVATIMPWAGAEVDRAVFEIDDNPVEPRTGHDLHRGDRGNRGDRPEGRASVSSIIGGDG